MKKIIRNSFRRSSTDLQRFQVRNLQLIVDPACYLVRVTPGRSEAGETSLWELPDWIFTSKHAIWLVEENKPIAERARDGELIRKELRTYRRTA